MKAIFLSVYLACGFAYAGEDAYVHGKDHCYYMTTPQGWVLNNQIGRQMGVPIVAYPIGRTWQSSATVIYTRIADKFSTEATPSDVIKIQVQKVLNEFRKNDSNDKTQAALIKSINNKNGSQGELWQFSGDRWGNTELAAYFPAKNTLNFFVMSSRTKEEFDRFTPALLEIADSYREGDDCVPCSSRTDELACATNKVDVN